MYERILVPLDGSQTSEAVLPWAKDVAHKTGATLILCNAFLSPRDVAIESVEFSPMHIATEEVDRTQAMAEAYLLRIARELSDYGVRAEIVAEVGNAAETILLVAEEYDADLIAMSTHGRSGLDRLVHGSVAETVMRNSTAPVLLVKPERRVKVAAYDSTSQADNFQGRSPNEHLWISGL